MAIDYDLVIVGGTPEAIKAAEFANQLGARVALVVENEYNFDSYVETICHQALNCLNFTNKKNISANNIFTEMLSIITEQSYHNLTVLGVDIIFGKAEFCRLPKPALIVNQRKLHSVSYLIATSAKSIIPKITGIESIKYLTPEDIYQQQDLTKLAENIVIIGDSIKAIQLSQQLNKLGKKITLTIPKNSILPQEDLDVSFIIQAQLEAEGIKVLTNSLVTQIKQIDNNKWVQAGNKAIETDEIIIATSLKQPNISGLNLEGMKVELNTQGIKVNNKLQTTNSKIYACGDVIGGYNLLNIAQYEAKIAVKNALFFNSFKVKYNYLAYTLFTNPQIARVGLTETEARKIYADKITIIKANFSELNIAKISENNTGFCKLIVLDNGEIIGAHLVGKNVGEFIGTIALAVQNKITLNNLANLTNPSLTYSEILNQVAIQWKSDRFRQNKRIINLLETLFIWRRSWFS